MRCAINLLTVCCCTLPLFGAEHRATPATLDVISTNVQPGDTIVLADGIYTTALTPARSGTARAPIVYRAANAGKSVFKVDLEAKKPAIELSNLSHITIEGVMVMNAWRFIVAEGAAHITINNCHFENTRGYMGWESCRFRSVGNGIRLTNNFFKNGTDLVSIGPGDYHLIEGNTFHTAEHTPLVLLGVQRSVIRNNTFNNPVQRCMEIFASRKMCKDPGRPTQYCLLEQNHFTTGTQKKAVMGKITSSHAMKIASRNMIYRRNIIAHCQSAVNWAQTRNASLEASFCAGNRFYHNVIYDCGFEKGGKYTVAMATRGLADENYGDNVIVNNIFLNNHFYPGILFEEHPSTLNFGFIRPSSPDHFKLYNNIFLSDRPGEILFVTQRNRAAETYTLAALEKVFPATAEHNLNLDPRLKDPGAGDFHLLADSPCIDAGRPLTIATAGSKDNVLRVRDARYFCDGYGLVEGDILRVGEARRIRVEKVDYHTNSITVDRAVTVSAGTPVSLDYTGNAPDMGAFEFNE